MKERLAVPNWERLFYIRAALQSGWSVSAVAQITGIRPLVPAEHRAARRARGAAARLQAPDRPRELLLKAKKNGFSDRQLAHLLTASESEVRAARAKAGIVPVFKRVDTCGAEFEAHTPYLYSTYEEEDETAPTTRRKVMILGGGPNRIGQGIEFDYCCCHASFALREEGFETIMVNCNPETVSTEYDTSDRLYFEPLTLEDVLNIVEREKPEGVIVQFGGQTPLFARARAAGDGREDPRDFARLRSTSPRTGAGSATFLGSLGSLPRSGTPARSLEEAGRRPRRSATRAHPALATCSAAGDVRRPRRERARRAMRQAVEASPEHPS
jgi:carbamoyl-phosphate synthase large subunit